ncbi:cytochrome B [Ectothiorhodospira haloalkaliphila]|uniref:Cytochrome b n=1 Tax=Ectothiorhodospira haloalkaliphila TaxID=421628 RepID=W8KML7_9GAMM|nr:cytochrome b N-terminal domain-containing protein [Ectothiorhodospira haloalkaliphila]AHK78242.1 cytochrome B [Ectothiorhodospira haloalkaliphila]
MRALLEWVDARYPLTKTWNEHLAQYYAPKNFNFWYYFGSLAMLVLAIQIVSGIFLTMFYKPDAELAFASVEYIMRDVEWGWLIRYMHTTGASAFFIVVYLHMFRALLYGSYKKPRELVWVIGVAIYLVLMAEAFAGYMLPWGQMSYWGAQVIVNLFATIPFIGPELVTWIRGDFLISDATLTRFFALHVAALPLVLIMLVFAHIVALHAVGSNNPDGVDIKKFKGDDGVPLDGIPFHPYYTVKDMIGFGVFLILFFAVVFFAPEAGGYFIEKANFEQADPMVTPDLIHPVWYFGTFYTILRVVPDPFLGVLLMFGAVLILFFLPWLDRNPINSVRYRSAIHKFNLVVFAIAFIVLGWLGMQAVEPFYAELGLRLTTIYCAFFFVLWFHSKPRSFTFSWASFLVIVAGYTYWDFLRVEGGADPTMAMTWWLLPTAYLTICLLAPLYTSFNEEKPVPARVTS